MNKVKMLVLAALVAATVVVGALAAAPSASAVPISPKNCIYIYFSPQNPPRLLCL